MLAKKLRTHPLKPILEELVRAIQTGISHLEEGEYPVTLIVLDVDKVDKNRLPSLLRDCQVRHGSNYTIQRAYTTKVIFNSPHLARITSYDFIYYRDGQEYGITFLPHEGLFDILGHKD